MSLHVIVNRISERMSMKTTASVLPILLVLSLGGCAAFQGFPDRPTNPADDLKELQDAIAATKIKQCLDLPMSSSGAGGEDEVSAPSTPGDATTGSDGTATKVSTVSEQETCRNQFVAARMYAVDLQFSQFEEDLFRQTRETGFGTTLATLGLTTTGAFVSGGASQVLSGIAAFIIGGREAFQKEVLAERTLIAIHTSMRANRARVGVRLRLGLQKEIKDYPLGVALSDVNDYYDAGTILGALVGITESVGTEAEKQSQRLENVTRNRDPDTGEPITGVSVIGGAAPPPGNIEGARTAAEEEILVTELRTIQGFLCAEVDGVFGDETRSAIKLWQQPNGFKVTGTLEGDRQARLLFDQALIGGQCDLAVHRNANERLNLTDAIPLETFRADLAELVLQHSLDTEVPESVGSIQELREQIEKAGGVLGVDAEDGVTPEFQIKLSEAVPDELPPPAPMPEPETQSPPDG